MKKTFIITILTLLFIALLPNEHGHTESEEDLYIKVNLWKKELLFIENNVTMERYSISIGTELTPTPIGRYRITEKAKAWGGGFGSRWLGLDVPWGVYGIHGTNQPTLIGKNVSSGCIRMHNKDVENLFEKIPLGTKVHIEGPITGTGAGELNNLSIGSKGNLVQLVQGRLKGLGFYNGETDGNYGSDTDWAVRKFQKENRISINGVISYREYLLLAIIE